MSAPLVPLIIFCRQVEVQRSRAGAMARYARWMVFAVGIGPCYHQQDLVWANHTILAHTCVKPQTLTQT
jgi:hypothetical protein